MTTDTDGSARIHSEVTELNAISINWIAVFVCAAGAFVIGGVWYSPLLFGKAWQRLNAIPDEALQKNMARTFAGSAVLSFVIAANLAAFLGADATLGFGLGAAGAAGVGWVGASMGITYLFERRPLALFLINAGYHVVAYLMMGAILTLWP